MQQLNAVINLIKSGLWAWSADAKLKIAEKCSVFTMGNLHYKQGFFVLGFKLKLFIGKLSLRVWYQDGLSEILIQGLPRQPGTFKKQQKAPFFWVPSFANEGNTFSRFLKGFIKSSQIFENCSTFKISLTVWNSDLSWHQLQEFNLR